MRFSIRALLGIVALASILQAAATSAIAQAWPTRFVTLIVPFGPGSGSDVVARLLGTRISEEIGQQLVVENVGGAGGTIAVTRAARAAPDGYQIVLGAVDTFAQVRSLNKTISYDPESDFAPIGLAVEQPLVLIVRNTLPVTDLRSFAEHLRANPAKLQFGSGGAGSAPHLVCAQFVQQTGAQVAHVSYRGSAPAFQDMIAGNLDFYCPLAVGAIPLIENRSVKALAILTPERSALLPNLPTAAEQGFPGIDGYYWIGFFAPKGTPEPIIAKLNAAIGAAIDTPSIATRLKDVGTTIVAKDRRTPAYLAQFVRTETEKWAANIKASGIVPQ